MTQQEFREKAKNWLNNKIILSEKSPEWYKDKTSALICIKHQFSSFLSFTQNYSVGDLALKIKRNEDLLFMLLPNPHNYSYNKALLTLNELLEYATDFVNSHNLQNLVSK